LLLSCLRLPRAAEFAGLGIYLNRSGMLLDDNVIAKGETKERPRAEMAQREPCVSSTH
jgi:hypothetical protein